MIQSMPKAHPIPRVNRVDFYRFNDTEFLTLLARATRLFAEQHPGVKLSRDHAAVVAWAAMGVDVPNGGFTQFFYNHRGDVGVERAADLLDELEVAKAAAVVRDALAVYRQHRSSFAVDNPFDGLFGSIQAFKPLDRAFYRVMLRGVRAVQAWAREHAATMFTGDDHGGPIDPKYTGAVDVLQPNGLVGQSLDVRGGRPSGSYREYFDDGSVRQALLYKNGKLFAECWPSGQLRTKEFKRGPHRVIEWYHANGVVQKRFVADKNNFPVEPVRLYYESGQLAEEQHVHQSKALGPWLKSFEDGSPRLVAEWTKQEELVVRDAWDDHGRQVVKDGAGTFQDDGRRITPFYALFRESAWTRTTELRDGRPHGKATSWLRGVLWSICQFDKGEMHGDATLYWDNGRLRSVTEHIRGKAGKTQNHPKFDRPCPAVVLGVEADERLYAAWKHARVDEYPQPLNLPQVQSMVAVPEMLHQVHQRNLAGALNSDYEDLNTFNDGITYMVGIDESGKVLSVRPGGSRLYSGGLWDVYPPLIRELRFKPGRSRGRAVPCSAVVRVDHTFVEAAAPPPT